MNTIILDPGHGMSNKRKGVFDPGVVYKGVRECDIAMDWANDLRGILIAAGKKVVRTRANDTDPAPVGDRAAIARHYKGDIMISLHVNSTPGASGTETFYRGQKNQPFAVKINAAVCKALGTKNRGAKTESASQHARLAVMSFDPCFLIEIGFIENDTERGKMLDPVFRHAGCVAIAEAILAQSPDCSCL